MSIGDPNKSDEENIEEWLNHIRVVSMEPGMELLDYRRVYNGWELETDVQYQIRKQMLEDFNGYMTRKMALEREYARHVEVMTEKMGKKEEVVDKGAEKVKGMIEKLIGEARG